MKIQKWGWLLLTLLITTTSSGFSQQVPHAEPTDIDDRLSTRNNPEGRVKSASISVTYSPNFPKEAKNAFEYAKTKWELILKSSKTIYVHVKWQPLGRNTLASTGAPLTRDFYNAPFKDVNYPLALAEKILNHGINKDGDADINMLVSSDVSWHFGIIAGNTPENKVDFVTTMMHELAHGLGIIDSYEVDTDNGKATVGRPYGGLPTVYDVGVVNGAGENIYIHYAKKPVDLATQLTSNDLFCTSSSNNNAPVHISAPSTFNKASSISHLDEDTFNGTSDRLLTPIIEPGESCHEIGPVLKNMLSDLGWDFTRVDLVPLKNTSDLNGPYIVKARVVSDFPEVHDVKLHYNTGGADIELPMNQVNGLYQASIPGGTLGHTKYAYYVSAQDARNIVYTNPGKKIEVGVGESQTYLTFTTGPTDPLIRHRPKEFIYDTDQSLTIKTIVTDDQAIDEVELQYNIGGEAYAVPFELESGSSRYSVTIDLSGRISKGDVIKYRIKAWDTESSPNYGYSPSATGYHTVKVIGLEPVRDRYQNDFHTELRDVNFESTDFAGQHFSLMTSEGFSSGAIHSQHPFPSGESFPDDEFDLVYQLLVPIRVQADDATIKFDEVVLAELFSGDYVVVEGSKDSGETWITFGAPYDSHDNDAWVNRYYEILKDDNSTVTGDESLYRSRVIDMLTAFDAGDEILIRFRLHSDVSGTGWGWAIDNLKIQIDDQGPLLNHKHHDYIKSTTSILPIVVKASDPSGVESVSVEYFVNADEAETFSFPAFDPDDINTLNLELDRLQPGDVIHYRIKGEDTKGNISTLPVSGYFNVPTINFGLSISSYESDFNSPTTDFAGNFFSVTQPDDFEDGAIHSDHFYANGFGLDNTSDYTYTLLKPICVSADNPYVKFDEITIVESQNIAIPFGSEAFNDYAIVEGSSDKGETWLPLADGYDALSDLEWDVAVNEKEAGYPWYYRPHVINLMESGDFHGGDVILLRFRLHADAVVNAWGWVIDNLNIQNAAAIAEQDRMEPMANQPESMMVQVYPNPVTETITVSWADAVEEQAEVILMNASGQVMYRASLQEQYEKRSHEIDVRFMNDGLYLVKVGVHGKNINRKVMKVHR